MSPTCAAAAEALRAGTPPRDLGPPRELETLRLDLPVWGCSYAGCAPHVTSCPRASRLNCRTEAGLRTRLPDDPESTKPLTARVLEQVTTRGCFSGWRAIPEPSTGFSTLPPGKTSVTMGACFAGAASSPACQTAAYIYRSAPAASGLPTALVRVSGRPGGQVTRLLASWCRPRASTPLELRRQAGCLLFTSMSAERSEGRAQVCLPAGTGHARQRSLSRLEESYPLLWLLAA